jgi:hypothetical protein
MLKRLLLLVVLAAPLSAQQQTLQLTPNSGRPGTTIEVTINAPVDAQQGRISFEPPGLTVTNVRLGADQQSSRFTLIISPAAQPGAYTFVYDAPDNQNIRGGVGQFRQPNAFTVLRPPPPSVTSIDPAVITAGDTANLRITGANFQQGARVEAGNRVDIVVTSVTPSEINGRITAAPNAPEGSRNVVVTNPDGGSNANQPAQLRVVARSTQAPDAREIAPSTFTAGTMVPVTITGENFSPGLRVLVADGVTVAVTAVTTTRINAAFSVDATAPVGPRFVVVTNPNGTADPTPVQIAIVARPPEMPSIRTVVPSSFVLGTTTAVSITGVNFVSGLGLDAGPGVSIDVQSVTPTTIAATFRVDPSAAPGQRRLGVRNPDGGSNANQAPVLIALTAPPVSTPPGGTPPGTTPPGTTPPGTTPVTPPVTRVPPARPVPTPPPVVPRPQLPRIDPRLAPRVDVVSPRAVDPGTQHTLTLQGANFTAGMSVSFGNDITVVGPPFVRSPREATVTVILLPTAAGGTRTVAVRSESGSSSGPGSLLVSGSAVTPARPAKPGTPVTTKVTPKRPLPKGDIILEAPLDPESLKCVSASGVECAPEVLTLDTVFKWRETNPGIADYFTIEIIDPRGKVLASAQTKQRHYRVTSAFMASIPALDPTNARKTGTPRRPKNKGGETITPTKGLAVLPGSLAGISEPSRANAAAVSTKPMMPGGGVGQAGSFVTEVNGPGTWHDRPGIAYWRVIGFHDERDVNGKRSGNFVAVEDSWEEAIILPLPPTGITSCDTALSSSTVKVGSKIVIDLPNECESPAIICAGEDVTLSGTIDLSRVPFDVGSSMTNWPPKPLSNKKAGEAIPSSVSFSNVFIDWGDGSEPERLSVSSTAIRSASSVGLSALDSYSGASKGDAGSPIRHRYLKASPSGGFPIKIYSVSDPDKTPTHSVATANYQLASVRGGATAGQFAEQARKIASAPTTHLIACAKAEVVDAPGASEEEGLHLIAAAVSWPAPYEGSSDPKVSACSEALRPKVRIDYWGQGRVRLSWLVNGDATPIEQTELTLHGVSKVNGEGRKMPRYEELRAALPLSSTSANKLVARIEVIYEAAPAPAPSSGGGSKISSGGSSLYGGRLGAGLYSFTQVNTTVKAGSITQQAAVPNLSTVIKFAPPGSEPKTGPSEISSAARSYSIVPVKEGELCRLVYPTTLGDFYVTDLTNLEEKSGGWSGKGTVRIDFPTGSGATKPEYVPVSFTAWQLGEYKAGERRVLSGTADATLTTELTPLSFSLKLTKLKLDPTVATVDGNLGLTAAQLPTIPGAKYPTFPFAKLPINPSGDLYFETSTPVEVPLGFSGFNLRIAKAVIDFSSAKGESAAATSCKETATGAAWTGILISGTLGAPDFSFGSAGKMLPDVPFERWSFGPGGFGAEIHRDLGKTMKLAGDLAINVGKLDIVACNSSFDAKVGLQLTGVPLVEEPFAGEIQVTSSKGILAKFGGTAIKKDWTIVALNIGRADFKYDSSIGDWAVSFDADATLKLPNGMKVYEHEFAGFKVTLDGKLASPGGSDWIAAGDTGPASLGGFPVQVTKIGAGARAGGGVWFGISGAVQFAKVLKAEGSDIRFKLDRTSGGAYRMAGVDVGSLKIDFTYPEGSPTVRANAEIAWQMEGSTYRFAGEGGLSIVGSLDVSAGFLYGRDPSIGSYWLAKADTTFPAPVPFAPTPLGLYGIGGGLGYKVPIEAFDIPITKVRPSASAGYAFSALVKVGTVADGGFTVFADGRLTIATGAGVRLDVGAWLLTKDHGGAPHAKGCIQYAGGSFDAGFGLDYKFAGDQIVVSAPSGPDTCKTAAVNIHFGPDTWHVWLGSEPNPIKVKVLIFNGRGYLMADSAGIRTSVTADFKLAYRGDIAGFGGFVDVGGSSTVGLGLGFDPFSVSGKYGASVNGRAGVIVVGKEIAIGIAAGVDVTVSFPPLSACGGVHIAIEIPVFPDISTNVSACI